MPLSGLPLFIALMIAAGCGASIMSAFQNALLSSCFMKLRALRYCLNAAVSCFSPLHEPGISGGECATVDLEEWKRVLRDC